MACIERGKSECGSFLLSVFIKIEKDVYSDLGALLELLVIKIKRFEIMIKAEVKSITFKGMHS